MPGCNSRYCLPVMHACMCVSVTWAVHVQVFGRTMVCKDTTADIVCLSCMHVYEYCMGTACAGV